MRLNKQMNRKLIFEKEASDLTQPRIGGQALIGGVLDWPKTPEGIDLLLIASIPNNFLIDNCGLNLDENLHTSVFSYYSKEEYFLDYITYHGDPAELEQLDGYTLVVQHAPGEAVKGKIEIPSRLLEVGERVETNYSGSMAGDHAGFLQNENLNTGNLNYVLQLYGGSFPKPFNDVFYLSDAVGYVYISSSIQPATGLFFVQVT